MIKNFIVEITTVLIMLICISCNNSNSKKIISISDYGKPTENIILKQGLAICDTLEKNIHTHKIISGDKYVITYKRTGITINDSEDWDTKFEETLIFQIDTAKRKFEYCNEELENISCTYFWICYSKEIKKEIIEIEKGCIKGEVSNKSLDLTIDINTNFGFGSFLEKKNKREIKIDKNIQL